MNNIDMTYSMRNMMNSGRNMEEQQYDLNTMEMMNNSMNQNYMMNGAVLNNMYQNEYMTDKDKFTTDMINQMQLEQAMNNYNNSISMNNATVSEHNDSMNVQGMKTNIDNSEYENYRNLMNYNNTQNTIQANQIPMNMEEINNNEASLYMNQNTGEMYSEEYMKNLSIPADQSNMQYSSNYKMNNGNYNSLMQNQYGNLQYPGQMYENMNNQSMYMQSIPQQKLTRNIPMSNLTPSTSNLTQNINHNVQQGMMPLQQNTSLRKTPILNKKRNKPKKFFPCC